MLSHPPSSTHVSAPHVRVLPRGSQHLSDTLPKAFSRGSRFGAVTGACKLSRDLLLLRKQKQGKSKTKPPISLFPQSPSKYPPEAYPVEQPRMKRFCSKAVRWGEARPVHSYLRRSGRADCVTATGVMVLRLPSWPGAGGPGAAADTQSRLSRAPHVPSVAPQCVPRGGLTRPGDRVPNFLARPLFSVQ